MSEGRHVRLLLVLVLAALLVNLPLVHSTWTDRKIQADGKDVQATVVEHSAADGQHFLSFRLPESVDPAQKVWSAQVDAAAYESAVQAGTVQVRVLPGDPASYTVDGEVGSRALVVITLIGDVLLVIVGLLLWRYGGRRRPQLRALALEDVSRSAPGVALDRLALETYLVRGEVTEVEPDHVVIDVGGRTVLVLLDGHHNPVGHQQAAEVRVRLI